MCADRDIQVMGKGNHDSASATIATASTLLVPYAPDRVTLVISAPAANRLTLSWARAAVDKDGIVLYATGPPLVLNVRDHGVLVHGPIFGIMTSAGEVIGYAQSFVQNR